MSLRTTSRSDWIEQNTKGYSLVIKPDSKQVHDDEDTIRLNLQEFGLQDFNDGHFDTVILDRVLERMKNPVEGLIEAAHVCSDTLFLVVLDDQRSDETEVKRTYTGRHIFDQCIKAGFNTDNIKIDHLNEYGEDKRMAFWLATITVS